MVELLWSRKHRQPVSPAPLEDIERRVRFRGKTKQVYSNHYVMRNVIHRENLSNPPNLPRPRKLLPLHTPPFWGDLARILHPLTDSWQLDHLRLQVMRFRQHRLPRGAAAGHGGGSPHS